MSVMAILMPLWSQCNSAPRTPTVVQWSDWHMSCWHGGSLCTFPSLPRVILPGNAAHAPHISFVCAPCYRLRYQHNQSSCLWAVFSFFFFFHPPLTRNVYSHISAPAMAAGVSILSDPPYSMSGARSGEISTQMEMETGKESAATQKQHYSSCGGTGRENWNGLIQWRWIAFFISCWRRNELEDVLCEL